MRNTITILNTVDTKGCTRKFQKSSRHAMGRSNEKEKRDRTPLPERFWKYVSKTPDGCWLWVGRTGRNGYGQISIKRKETLAHRYSYFLAHGQYPSDCCLHSCDVHNCVNPDHLRNGSRQDNMRDRMERQPDSFYRALGTQRWHSKFTDIDVLFVKLWLKRRFRRQSIADVFNVHYATIHRIATGQRYTDNHLA